MPLLYDSHKPFESIRCISLCQIGHGDFGCSAHVFMPHAQSPAALGTPLFGVLSVLGPLHKLCAGSSYFQDPHIPPTGGPREPTFFFSHTTSPFPAHPFVAPAFKSPYIPNRIFSGAGFRRLAKTQREALLITLRSKKQKSASQGICPVVGLLGHVVVLFLVF